MDLKEKRLLEKQKKKIGKNEKDKRKQVSYLIAAQFLVGHARRHWSVFLVASG